jgi:hypothetical protein
MIVDHIFESFVGHALTEPHKTPLPRNFECLKTLVNTFDSACGKL